MGDRLESLIDMYFDVTSLSCETRFRFHGENVAFRLLPALAWYDCYTPDLLRTVSNIPNIFYGTV